MFNKSEVSKNSMGSQPNLSVESVMRNLKIRLEPQEQTQILTKTKND